MLSSSRAWEGVRAGEESREESRSMSSTSSVGSVSCILVWAWLCRADFEVVVIEAGEEERSRFRRADLRSCDLELRIRAAFKAYVHVSTWYQVDPRVKVGVLQIQHPALSARGATSLNHWD